MKNNRLSMETLNELRLMGAWKKMSEEFPWNEDQLERYKAHVDWNLLSANGNVAWTLSLLEHFKEQLNWKELSQNNSAHLFQPEMLRAFADCWDWTELSQQEIWTTSLIEEFKDRINWAALLENHNLNDEGIFNEAFLRKYYDYIQFDEFILCESRRYSRNVLWEKLCDESYMRLSDEVTGLTKK